MARSCAEAKVVRTSTGRCRDPAESLNPVAPVVALGVQPTLRPHPVTTTDTGTFDTSQGTVYLVLGGGGTSDPTDTYETDAKDGLRQAKVFTKPNNPVLTATADVYARAAADAVEDAIWSANRDPATGYGIAVFDVDPGTGPGNQTSITVTYLHAVGADGAPVDTYTELETFTLTRPRSDA